MILRWIIIHGLLLWLGTYADQSFENDEIDGKIYTNTWAVQLDAHDASVADELAANLGFENRGAIASLPGHFKFVHRQTEDRQKRSAEQHTQPLLAHPRVRWAKQQTQLFRFKRGFEALEQNIDRYRREEQNKRHFNDPEWPKQWYLYDNGFSGASGNLGVLEATRRGYTGKGVVVSIVDDGLDHRHPDLSANYDPKASIDLNDGDYDPIPDDSKSDNAHGTECGGEVAAAADNGVCGVGVAYNASIGGIRMLDGTVTDLVEADALGYNCDYIDIKSASWGPKDDGKTFGCPEKLGADVMKNCALRGRQGRGLIYVWANGNGGAASDNCNCDGYTSSIYTLSVGSISPGGFCTTYDEKCPSTLGVVYTGDVGDGKREEYGNLVTTALFNKCVDRFSGTSCAAPLAAGIVALVLQANPKLTWRDMQHLVVETARKNDPRSSTWNTNAAGHNYSLCYGFGVLNAMDMINKAKDWKLVGDQLTREVRGQLTPETSKIPSNGILTLKLRNDDDTISTLEHVQLVLSVEHRRRGDMVIELTSPQGTTSQLLAKRPNDDSTDGLDKWPFTSVEFWGENPRGEWTVKIKDDKSKNSFSPRNNQNVLFDEEKPKQRDEPILNDLTHGRFKEDYMKLAGRSKGEFFQQSDEPNVPRELHLGRFKEDDMNLRAHSSEPSNVKNDKSKNSLSARHNQDVLSDEDKPKQSDETILNDLTHGRFKEDYMKLAGRSKGEFFQQSDEPNVPRELHHGRFKEDDMNLRADSSEPGNVESDKSKNSLSARHNQDVLSDEEKPKQRDETILIDLTHGRFKEDYMKLKADSSEPSNVESDESACSPSGDLKGPVAGCVTEWSLVTYGTA